jgi:lysophospholipase L1-like esterase
MNPKSIQCSLLVGAVLALVAHISEAATQLGEIMPLGDSITWGGNDTGPTPTFPGGYRDPLALQLQNGGYGFDFVGTQTANSTTFLTTNGWAEHEGHPGALIQDVEADIGGPMGWLTLNPNPEYILLLIGTNNMVRGDDPSAAASELGALLSHIAQLAPSANLIVAQLPPTRGNPVLEGRVVNYNSAIASQVDQRRTTQRVTLVDMHSALDPAVDIASTDQIHPDQSGYDKMAGVWFAGIQAVPEPGAGILVVAGGMLLLTRRAHRGSTERDPK